MHKPGLNHPAWRTLAARPRRNLMRAVPPLLPLAQLSRRLGGTDIWCKRDDLISFGLGGNKIRGLEFLAADALNCEANVLVTGAGAQSNHVRATAAAASYFGLDCVAVFWGKPPSHRDGNFRVTCMLGADAIFTGDDDRASVDVGIEAETKRLTERGRRPYAIPRGGACALGALGHAAAAREVYEQCRMLDIVPATVVLATGSGGTHAGWLLGTRLLGNPWRVESYTVSRDAGAVREQIVRLATEAAAVLGLSESFGLDEVVVHGGYIGPGYGIPSAEAADAIRLLGRIEGLLLDPTYTGKAMAGLLDSFKWRRYGGQVLFIHTGGEPAYFAGDGSWLSGRTD
ncbi:coenzyme M biosynthesis enzyme XcbE [Methylomonas sp. MgM2]